VSRSLFIFLACMADVRKAWRAVGRPGEVTSFSASSKDILTLKFMGLGCLTSERTGKVKVMSPVLQLSPSYVAAVVHSASHSDVEETDNVILNVFAGSQWTSTCCAASVVVDSE